MFDAAEVPERPRRIAQGVLSVIAPWNWSDRHLNVLPSDRFQNTEYDDATGRETLTAGTGWKGTVAAGTDME